MRGIKKERGAGWDFSVSKRPPSEEESCRIGERRRESPGPSVEGEAEHGGGGLTAEEDEEEGFAGGFVKRRRGWVKSGL